MARKLHPVASADLVLALASLPASAHALRRELAAMLGYRFDPTRLVRDEATGEIHIDIQRPARPSQVEQLPWRSREHHARHWRARSATYLEGELAARVDPLAGGEERLDPEQDIGVPAQAVPAVSRQSVLAWSRLRRTMEQVFRQPRPGTQVDIAAVINRIAEGEALTRIPRRMRRTPAQRMVIVVDRSAHLVPIWKDQLEIFVRARRELGEAVLLRWWDEGPPRQCSDARVLEQIDPALAPGDVVLVLGDLCVQASDSTPHGYRAWRALGQALRRRGVFTAALLPLPTARWPNELPRAWNAIEWERPRGGRRYVPQTRRLELEGLLLALCSWVARLEPELLRALRSIIPGADLGHELDLWNHPDAHRHSQGLLLSADQRRRGQQELRKRMQDPSDTLIRKAIECVRRHHAPLAREIWTEELTTLELLGPGLWLDASERERVERFTARMRNELTLDDSERSSELHAWFGRAHGPDPGSRKPIAAGEHPRLGPALERSLELFLDAEGRKQATGVDVFRRQTQGEALRRWQLRERDGRLWLGAQEAEAEGDRIAELAGRGNWVSINGVGYAEPAGFTYSPTPADTELVVTVPGQRLTLEHASIPGWAHEWGHDGRGLWADFKVKGVLLRMLWIPPGDSIGGEHRLDEGYWLSKNACSEELWSIVMDEAPAPRPSTIGGQSFSTIGGRRGSTMGGRSSSTLRRGAAMPSVDIDAEAVRAFCDAVQTRLGATVSLLTEEQRSHAVDSNLNISSFSNGEFHFSIAPESPTAMQPPTTRRALLLGATAPDLRGVVHDLELMNEALTRHGFTDIRTVTPATRDAIREGLAALIDATEPGDAVVLYYSGHASTLAAQYLDDTSRPPIGEPSMYRFLIPSDIEDSSEDDFRGFTSIELSEALAELTARTANVTAIMDCCHAGRVFRKVDEARERITWQDLSKRLPARHVALEGMFARSAAAHYLALRAEERSARVLHAEANPWAVQLLAADPSKPAFEVEVRARSTEEQSYYAGAMTIALHDALMQVDPYKTTWQDLGRMIRRTPQRGSSQRVGVEGPYRRFLFSVRERQPEGELALSFEDEQLRAAGGRLVGLSPGDELELFSLERGAFASIGSTQVSAVHSSWAELEPFPGSELVQSSSYARPARHATAKAELSLDGLSPEASALLEARLANSGLLLVSELRPDAGLSGLPYAGTLRATEERGRIELCAPNANGLLGLDRPRLLDPARSPRTAAALAAHLGESAHCLARAAMLRELPDPTGAERLPDVWDLSLHTVEHDQLARSLRGGETLSQGTRLTVTVRSEHHLNLWCNVLEIRADGRIKLQSRAQGGSVEISPETSYRLGQLAGDPSGRVRGIELEPPRRSGLDPDGQATQFDYIIVISDQSVDLRSWTQPAVRRFNLGEDVLGPASVKRNLSAPRAIGGARYHIERFSFVLRQT